MTDPLSIFAAAREARDGAALRVGDHRFTFGELADLTRARIDALAPSLRGVRIHPLVGTNSLDTVVTLYALLEQRVPALMLHPKLTQDERATEIEAAHRVEATLPPDAAGILYTSGTTGRSRGAVLTRAALAASARASAANLGWVPDDCWLLAMPVARVGGLSIITRCLAARRAVALVPGFDAGLMPHWIAQHRTTLVSLVPTMLALMLDKHPGWTPPPFLRAVLLGGAATSPRLFERAAQRRIPIVVTYGCTETCSQVVVTPYSERFDAASHAAGAPLPGVELRVADGRILVRGPMLMAGYLGEPPLPRDAWFDTGDVGELDPDGRLHVHARAGDLIITGGENVYPAEVERVLETCPGIRAAGVFGVPDETWGQIVGAALVADGEPPDDDTLLRFLARHLARYKRPRLIRYVQTLPQTGAGKLDRSTLASLAGGTRALREPNRE